jgi:uncharacterized membrane protein (UPF0182 family)
MRNWKRLLTIAGVTFLILTALAVAAGVLLTDFLVDYWWFSSLEYEEYFWLRLLYRYIFSGGVTLFLFLIFFLNFWAASRYLGVDQEAFAYLTQDDDKRRRKLLQLFQSGSLQVYTPLSLMLGILVAVPFYRQWESALLFFFGPEAGMFDPVYRKDVSFHLFQLPIYDLVQTELLIAFAILTLAVAVLYWLEHRLLPTTKKEWPPGVKNHLSLLIFVNALILAWGFILDLYDLFYTDVHEPLFFGPGFVEWWYARPLLWGCGAILLALALAAIHWARTGKGMTWTAVLGVAFLACLGLRQIDLIPKLIDRFLVKPNPVKSEGGFMQYNIHATHSAYALDRIKTIEITAAEGTDLIDPHTREQLHNIPIWDPEYLDDVYQQLQGIRPYYNFTDVDVGRYEINGKVEQVNLAARELNIAKLPPEARNWENTFLRYTHGYGAVITPAAQDGEAPMRWFLRDLSLQSDVGFDIEKPDIYYGTENLNYAIVPNKLDIVDISSFDEMGSSQNYSGKGGVNISSLFRKLLIALYFRDEKLFFSPNVGGASKALFRRNIVERIQTLTPFLKLDRDPYLVVTPKRLYWVQDAYTVSEWYPVAKSTRFQFAGEYGENQTEFNYIRNSVKIVVDAFDGAVDYYVSDFSDPITQGYRNAYPNLFKDITAMPPQLREQIRYPKDIFAVQMEVYAKYHQTDPALFYQQAETWDFAKVGENKVKPYYLTTYLEGLEDMQDFILLNPMTPIGRNNLSVLGVAGTLKFNVKDEPSANKIVVYKFSRDAQVNGPSQVSALIDQDPDISRLFALWDQKGSHIQRGRIIMLPIGRSLLYVQPVYLVSTAATKIPELARIILAMGDVVIMDTSLERALDRLEAKLREYKIGPRPLPKGGETVEELPAAGPM